MNVSMQPLSGTNLSTMNIGMPGANRQIFDQLQAGVSGGLTPALQEQAKLAVGDPSKFADMEADTMRSFQREIVPQMTEQFSNLGLLDSTNLGGAIGSASADLASKLRSQRFGMQQDALKQLLDVSQNLMRTPVETTGFYQQPQQSTAMGQIGAATASAAGDALSSYIQSPEGQSKMKRGFDSIEPYLRQGVKTGVQFLPPQLRALYEGGRLGFKGFKSLFGKKKPKAEPVPQAGPADFAKAVAGQNPFIQAPEFANLFRNTRPEGMTSPQAGPADFAKAVAGQNPFIQAPELMNYLNLGG